MKLVAGSHRIITDENSNPLFGELRWNPVSSMWVGLITLSALLFGPMFFSWGAFGLFLITSAITLCAGHSVGMHRRLIHGSFECPLWLEYICVYLGVLVGMAGPIGMIRMHDMRDWAQRQTDCHPYFAHRSSFLRDGWYQLHCRLQLFHPPQFCLESRIAEDKFYRFLERTWILQQLPWAIIFYISGGASFVVWGVCVRVAVCVTGHWLVGYFAHRTGQQNWLIKDACVQGYNIKFAGLISMGESWHNNHHAFPGSAKLGLEPGQVDLGWYLILLLKRLGLAWNIITPENLGFRKALKRIDDAQHFKYVSNNDKVNIYYD